jgi:mycothiol system anti-sigma-R factor
MNCAEIDRLLPAFADGEFEGTEQTEVEIHLAHCETCRESVIAQQVFRSIVREKVGSSEAPAALRGRIRHDISRERLTNQAQRYAVYSAVAVSLAGVASAAWMVGRPPAFGLEDMVRVSQHARELPIDFDPAVGDAAAWTRKHVPFNPVVPTSNLRGVRILPVHDQDGAVFFYGAGTKRPLTLMVIPDVGVSVEGRPLHVGSREVLMANHQGYNVAVLRRDGLLYSLVSELDERDVMQLLGEIAR